MVVALGGLGALSTTLRVYVCACVCVYVCVFCGLRALCWLLLLLLAATRLRLWCGMWDARAFDD